MLAATGMVIVTQETLRALFQREKRRWLEGRYFPDLHATSAIEKDLELRLGTPEARGALLERVQAGARMLRATHDDVARLPGYPPFLSLTNAREMMQGTLDALDRFLDAGARLIDALRRGQRLTGSSPASYEDERTMAALYQVLDDLDRRAASSRATTHEIKRQLGRCLGEGEEQSALLQIHEPWMTWLRAPVMAAYVGPPGVGKTHGITRATQVHLEKELPALLLRAKDCDVDEGWPGILRQALDCPGARLEEMLAAMEATAVQADAKRAQMELSSLPNGVEPEPTCFLLAIDGLDESGQHRRWAELLGDLSLLLENHPRLRVAVTLRTASREDILGHVRRDRFEERALRPDDGDVQRMLERYCDHYQVESPDHRLRWALREPLSVRLYCELKKQEPAWKTGRTGLSLHHLLHKKLELVEDSVRQRLGLSKYERPLKTLLGKIAEACVERARIPRDEAIRLALDAKSAIDSAERWALVLDEAERHGLLLVHTAPSADPMGSRITTVEPAYDPLTVESGIFGKTLPLDELERLELRAIAALEGKDAARYRGWVLEKLRDSMPSCRRVLKELCVPVARDPEHPFAPRFVHEALKLLRPVERDLFWSGPRVLPGSGSQPWEGIGDVALEDLSLSPDDTAEGPPLLLAWALTSVDNRWRRRVRAELASWGSRRLDELVRWLDITSEGNDPQMIEDIAMIAFGAACLAGADPRLGELVRWVDANWLAFDSGRRQENVVVLHAARGVVERARVMGIPVEAGALERIRTLYATGERLLPIDAEAARRADDHNGVSPITGDLAWYVVPRAIEAFFYNVDLPRPAVLEPEAVEILAEHANAARLPDLTPQRFAFGFLTAYLQMQGWSERDARGMDQCVRASFGSATHGSRSATSTLVEKYTRAGCDALQAFLAGRLPIRDTVTRKIVRRPPVDPVLIFDGEPNPASDRGSSLAAEDPWTFFPDDALAAALPLTISQPDDEDQLEPRNNASKAPSPPPEPPPAPIVPVGPQNPDIAVPLSTDLDRDDAIPYFLWDDPMPLKELRNRLATAPQRERDRLLGKILREARDPDVWRFTTPEDVARRFGALKRYLGRRRAFWEFLLDCWHKEGLLAQKPA